jgi:hypothetical protein
LDPARLIAFSKRHSQNGDFPNFPTGTSDIPHAFVNQALLHFRLRKHLKQGLFQMRLLVSIFLPIALAICAQAAPRKSAGKPEKAAASVRDNGLDTVRIHQAYLDGDFDLAIDMIETAGKYAGPFSHSDSVFIFKHLGVMYTAKYETRELGKQNMMKLLHTEPSARIMDMYASDMIYMIFKNIQDEFEVSQAKLARAKGHLKGSSQTSGSNGGDTEATDELRDKPPKGSTASVEKPRSHAWIGWTAAALAAAGGVTLYVLMADEPETERKVNTIQ